MFFQADKDKSATQAGVFYALGYVANWARAYHVQLGLAEATWSLSIEEQFYIVFPLLLLAGLARLSKRTLFRCALVSIGVVTVARIALVMSGADYARVYNGSDTRADSLLIGCAVALYVSWFGVPRGRWVKAAAAAAALSFLGYVAVISSFHSLGLRHWVQRAGPVGRRDHRVRPRS